MKIKLISFGQIEVEGRPYDYDLVIEQGKVRKRNKKASKVHRGDYGHTPLSGAEEIPWHGDKLYIGTGAYGSLPVMREVFDQAKTRGVQVIALPTKEVCRLVEEIRDTDVNAILHVTC